MEGLVQCSANYVALTPVSFLERAATVYRDKTSIVYGGLRFSWDKTYERCLKLASALVQLGVTPGDFVSSAFSITSFFLYPRPYLFMHVL